MKHRTPDRRHCRFRICPKPRRRCSDSDILFLHFPRVTAVIIIQHPFFFSATLDVLEIATEAALVAVITVIMLEIKLGDTWPPKQSEV